jgi:uncharacterized protein (TIGR03435 family)
MLSFLWRCALALMTTQTPVDKEAGDKLTFDVASVKPNRTGDSTGRTNVPLGPGNVFTPTGGYLSVVNYPLIALIAFAYKITGDQEQFLRARLPDWVLSDHFDIEARAAGNATKDEMRLMMRSLLADRFSLALHYETRQAPVFALVLAKAAKTGPRLRQRAENAPCTTGASPQTPPLDDGFPMICGGLFPLPHGPGRIARFGASNVTLTFIATQLSIMGQLGRPVLDRTGLSGNFDFTLEWAPEPAAPQTAEANPLPGPTFREALAEQLGLKIVSQTGAADFLIVDHVEHPSGN